MAVVPFSRLLPLRPLRATALPSSLSVHRLIPILSPNRCGPPTLSSRANALHLPRSSAKENGGASEALDEGEVEVNARRGKEQVKEDEEQPTTTAVAELKEMMAARKKREEQSDLWGGVAEEIKEIEWPAFGRVLSTTGVVLAVIAGSSVALLTVNAVLAEISDRVFAGKGLQDFFG